ncbi:putative Ig domain protein [Prochlorococcus marinus str. MIT 1318]|uniref:putative Ig domain-containing protein n=1 Tax=Prochlorococcus TaxID=1218 RepID=UPI0007B368BF|nr:putative Ig domain-containing protein [Prochlorococcus marinus]KZR77684.1 putative Ig domain protein [Prochlorococcus marinus str. MIT 1318]
MEGELASNGFWQSEPVGEDDDFVVSSIASDSSSSLSSKNEAYSYDSLSIDLDNNLGNKTNVSFSETQSIEIEKVHLDQSLDSIAGQIPGLRNAQQTGGTVWNTEFTLHGNVEGTRYQQESYTINKSKDVDIQLSTYQQEKKERDSDSYQNKAEGVISPNQVKSSKDILQADTLSGLFLSSNIESTTLISDNLSPLIGNDYSQDALLVYNEQSPLVKSDSGIELLNKKDVEEILTNNIEGIGEHQDSLNSFSASEGYDYSLTGEKVPSNAEININLETGIENIDDLSDQINYPSNIYSQSTDSEYRPKAQFAGVERKYYLDDRDSIDISLKSFSMHNNLNDHTPVVVSSTEIIEKIVENLDNGEVIWQPINEDGGYIMDVDNNPLTYDFTLKEIFEDQEGLIPIGSYPPAENNDNWGEWNLDIFSLPGEDSQVLPSWLELVQMDPTPALVGKDKLVVSYKFIEDNSDPEKYWMEIYAHDGRENGEGLIGLELSLDWYSESITIIEDELTTNNVFNRNHLPLFQKTGSIINIESDDEDIGDRQGLTGLVAAALPNGNVGRALGNLNSEESQTLFARLPFHIVDIDREKKINIIPTLLPTIGAAVEPEELLIIGEESPKAWIIKALPDQQDVGEYAFTIQLGEGARSTKEYIGISVKEVNDPPELVSNNNLAIDLREPSTNQGVELIRNISPFFKDQDDSNLSYKLLSGPSWLQLNSQTGILSGTPLNKHVGETTIKIEADDGRQGTITKEVPITVINVNDSPEVGILIQPPNLKQEQEFIYRLPKNSFVDIDLDIDSSEELNYEIVSNHIDNDPPQWLTINSQNGHLEGKPGNQDVGLNQFIVRCTDNYGLYTDQAVSIQVQNVNDAPQRTDRLEDFLNKQIPTVSGETPPSEVDQDAIFIGLNRSINIRNWFTDQDIAVDQNESLTINIELDAEDRGIINLEDISDFQNQDYQWLDWDSNSGILNIRPEEKDLGEHILMIRVNDMGGLNASALVPIYVRHRNRAPFIAIQQETELLSNIQTEGVDSKHIKYLSNQNDSARTIKGLEFNLTEESDVVLQLPLSLFGDRDLNIDPAEKLTYSFTGEQELFHANGVNSHPMFTFDPTTLKFIGSTRGLALNSSQGFKSWSGTLTATDSVGEQIDFEVDFNLQRTVNTPTLKLINEGINYNEGHSVPVNELINVEITQTQGEFIELTVELMDGDGEDFDLIQKNNNDDIVVVQPDSIGIWKINGSASQIKQELNTLHITPKNNNHAIGEFTFGFAVQSNLGNTGLYSNKVAKLNSYILEPTPNIPVWVDHDSATSNQLDLTTLGSIATALSPDPREEINYKLELPSNRKDLLITNSNGQELGNKEGDLIILTEDEWLNSILRTTTANENNAEVNILAVSTEPQNGLQALSTLNSLSLKALPYLDSTPNYIPQPPIDIQKSGKLTNLKFALDMPDGTKSIKLNLDMPQGTTVYYETKELNSSSFINHEGTSLDRFTITLDNLDESILKDLSIQLKSDESFRGMFEGTAHIVASAREQLPHENQLREDLLSGLAKEGNNTNFHWDVAQVARTPEFSDNGGDLPLNYNPNTGSISIPVRRGASSSGHRNIAEALTLSIRNIPLGYSLAQKINDKYIATGATDAFGTMTLFTIDPLHQNETQLISNFNLINDGDLYIVKTDDVNTTLDGKDLILTLTARISDQPGGDSRSNEVTRTLSLSHYSNQIPMLSDLDESDPTITNVNPSAFTLRRSEAFIDPVFISLNGEGLPLSDLSDSATQTEFKMLPNESPIPTAWLQPGTNQDNDLVSGLLVLNDLDNDIGIGDITIDSVTELISEYTRSQGRARSFYSGSDALKSLDINNDYILDSNDPDWSELKIWFDDGDTVSQSNEIRNISEFVRSIDLDTIQTIVNNPAWSAGNQILRKLSALPIAQGVEKYDLYDVGLRIAPSGNANLTLDVTGSHATENRDLGTLTLSSVGSNEWSNDGKDALTLIRLSGLPQEVVPSLGVLDSRGDWLFTWADLVSNGGDIKLIPTKMWSGEVNVQVLISQLQADGTFLSSALTSYALDVVAVADRPLHQLKSISITEDIPTRLSELLQRTPELVDIDGSEELHMELSDIPNGVQFRLMNDDGTHQDLNPKDQVITFSSDDIENIELIPPRDFSGSLVFKLSAVSKEKSNSSKARNTQTALITVKAFADQPSQVHQINTSTYLEEGGAINLTTIIDKQYIDNSLSDTDGSETLRLEIEMPIGLRIKHENNTSWLPIQTSITNGKRVVLIDANDADSIIFKENSLGPVEQIFLSITSISRELVNGHTARSNPKQINLPFARDAREANVILLNAVTIEEDSQNGIPLVNLLRVEAANDGDTLSYQINQLPSELKLVNKNGDFINPNGTQPILLNVLEDWSVVTEEDRSGSFSIDLQVISTPPSGGRVAITESKRLSFTVIGLADTPTLSFDLSQGELLDIGSNGWLNLGALSFSLESSDSDQSEQLSMIVGTVDNIDHTLTYPHFTDDLPSESKFNVQATKLIDGSWQLQETDLKNLSLFLGEIENDKILAFVPVAFEANSTNTGIPTYLTIKNNATVRVPLLEVQRDLEGNEDEPLPLLADKGGVLSPKLRGNGTGQDLYMKLSNLPAGSKLLVIDGTYDAANIQNYNYMNKDINNNWLSEVTLKYDEWENIYWLGPENSSGLFSFEAVAYSRGKSNNIEKPSESKNVQVFLQPTNDAPIHIATDQLQTVKEGNSGLWDLKDRFSDIDHNINDITFQVTMINDSGTPVDLPSWLSLSEQGVLSGIPTNTDVGSIRLQITASDPLGGIKIAPSSLSLLVVSDTNTAPTISNLLFNNWERKQDSGSAFYEKNMNLRERISLDLEKIFSDEDIINDDYLSYTISGDNADTWGSSITDLADINGTFLEIYPRSKQTTINKQTILLRATDTREESIIQKLVLDIQNINDPPEVDRINAEKDSNGNWVETVKISEGDTDWNLNLTGLFKDNDNDIDTIVIPAMFPWWSSYNSSSDYGGILRAINPTDDLDVGVNELEWRAIDQWGESAIYTLRLEVENVNERPFVRDSVDISELGQLSNDPTKHPIIRQDDYAKLDLGKLFDDPDLRLPNSSENLKYHVGSLQKFNEDENTWIDLDVESADWVNIYKRSSVYETVEDKIIIEPKFYYTRNNVRGAEIKPEEFGNLKSGDRIQVDILANDNRDPNRLLSEHGYLSKGLQSAHIEVFWSNAITLVDNTTVVTDEFPIGVDGLGSSPSFKHWEDGFELLAGNVSAMGMGSAVGDIGPESIVRFDVIIEDPSAAIEVNINAMDTNSEGQKIGEGINDIYRGEEDIKEVVIHSFTSQSKADFEILHPGNSDVGIYKVEIVATDTDGLSTSKNIDFEIENVNDPPTILDTNMRLFLQQIIQLFEEPLIEGDSMETGYYQLFSDIDDIAGDSLTLELHRKDISDHKGYHIINIDSYLDFKEDLQGRTKLIFTAPKGLDSVDNQSVRFAVKDIVNPDLEQLRNDQSQLGVVNMDETKLWDIRQILNGHENDLDLNDIKVRVLNDKNELVNIPNWLLHNNHLLYKFPTLNKLDLRNYNIQIDSNDNNGNPNQSYNLELTLVDEVFTDWFDLRFQPKADVIQLTIGDQGDNLESNHLGVHGDKGMTIDLATVLNFNAPSLTDSLGDELYLNIQRNQYSPFYEGSVENLGITQIGESKEWDLKQLLNTYLNNQQTYENLEKDNPIYSDIYEPDILHDQFQDFSDPFSDPFSNPILDHFLDYSSEPLSNPDLVSDQLYEFSEITVQLIDDDDQITDLPAWLEVDNSGILKKLPSQDNLDLKLYHLIIQSNDLNHIPLEPIFLDLALVDSDLKLDIDSLPNDTIEEFGSFYLDSIQDWEIVKIIQDDFNRRADIRVSDIDLNNISIRMFDDNNTELQLPNWLNFDVNTKILSKMSTTNRSALGTYKLILDIPILSGLADSSSNVISIDKHIALIDPNTSIGNEFYIAKTGIDGIKYLEIDFQKLSLLKQKYGKQNDFGNIEGISLSIDPSDITMLPPDIIAKMSNDNFSELSGMGIDVWTTTRVKGDIQNQFGEKTSPISTVWVPIRNQSPTFTPQQTQFINKSHPLFINNSIGDESDEELFNLHFSINDGTKPLHFSLKDMVDISWESPTLDLYRTELDALDYETNGSGSYYYGNRDQTTIPENLVIQSYSSEVDFINQDYPGKILIKPIFYESIDNGFERIRGDVIEYSDLPTYFNQDGGDFFVSVNATDNRSIALKGLQSFGFDLSWSESMELDPNSIDITPKLPLYSTGISEQLYELASNNQDIVNDQLKSIAPPENFMSIVGAFNETKSAESLAASQAPYDRELFDLNNVFTDSDTQDISIWEIEIPPELKFNDGTPMVLLDKETGKISLAKDVKKLDDLPEGEHHIFATYTDTAGALGDPSGKTTGMLRIYVESQNPNEEILGALDYLSRADSSYINNIFDLMSDPNARELDEQEKSIYGIFETFELDFMDEYDDEEWNDVIIDPDGWIELGTAYKLDQKSWSLDKLLTNEHGPQNYQQITITTYQIDETEEDQFDQVDYSYETKWKLFDTPDWLEVDSNTGQMQKKPINRNLTLEEEFFFVQVTGLTDDNRSLKTDKIPLEIINAANAEAEKEQFFKDFNSGSIHFLEQDDQDKPRIMLDARGKNDDKGLILQNPKLLNANQSTLSEAQQLDKMEEKEIETAPIGQLDFTVLTHGKKGAIVEVNIPKGGADLDTLIKTGKNGKPYIFESTHKTYDKQLHGPKDKWLANLPYSVHYYGAITDDKKFSGINDIKVTAKNSDHIYKDILKAGFDPVRHGYGMIDGSAYLIDLDNNKTIDLISMLLVDNGFFDTNSKPGVIGDPLIPTKTNSKKSSEGGGSDGVGVGVGVGDSGSDSGGGVSGGGDDGGGVVNYVPTGSDDTVDQPSTPDVTTGDSTPQNPPPEIGKDNSDEQDSLTTPSDFSDEASENSNLPIPSVTSEDQRKNKLQNTNISSLPVNRFSTTNNRLSNTIPDFNRNSIDTFANSIRNNNNFSGSNLSIKSQDSLDNSYSTTDSYTNWLNSRVGDVIDKIKPILSQILESPSTSMAMVFGMLMAPIAGERITTYIAKRMDKDLRLKLLSRSSDFKGRWVMPTRDKKYLLIVRNESHLELESYTPSSQVSDDGLTILPGFNSDGHSLLSQSIEACKNPGAFIRSIEKLHRQMFHDSTIEINWEAWISENFILKNTSAYFDNSNSPINELIGLVQRANRHDPALTDVVMISQIHDCSEVLGLNNKRKTCNQAP